MHGRTPLETHRARNCARRHRAQPGSRHIHVHQGAPATLLMHGDQDSVVGHEASERLHAALLAVGADSTLELTPGAEHCFIGTPIEPHLDRAVAFFRSHLGA
ncbi:alpha/beta hydrolase family protein [Ornithinimicrobium panacihumi]|uniref:alpha/beta hydrolase family protein n=1 Tax=Ornithinimicrobium panacihumi TaxID=2008449 RepID=UPI003F8B7582